MIVFLVCDKCGTPAVAPVDQIDWVDGPNGVSDGKATCQDCFHVNDVQADLSLVPRGPKVVDRELVDKEMSQLQSEAALRRWGGL